MEVSLWVLGSNHPESLTSMANLAWTYCERQLEEAESFEVQVMETRTKVLGKEHPDSLASMANLVSTVPESKTVEGGRDARVTSCGCEK